MSTTIYKSLSKPTRLYIKKCPHCDLKYFGKTTTENIASYKGSGKHWVNHLKKYKVKPVHLWNSDWYYDYSIKRFALKFSRLNKIVQSKKWANLKEEDGLYGGWDHAHNKETQEKALKNAKETIKLKYGVENVSQIPHVKESAKGKEPWNKGKTGIFSEDTLEKMSYSAQNRSQSHIDNISIGMQRYYQNIGNGYIFIDNNKQETFFCIKTWCNKNNLDYRKVYHFIDKGIIKPSNKAIYNTPTRIWFIGKEIKRLVEATGFEPVK